ncbi:MAG: hypothetical protein OIF38_14655, partial [Cellvibrionaceae bacterium]|nr:hypothetical protein [Cellvibrionaceae bacterium]
MKEWFLAVRPQTLIISIAPILLSQVEVYQAICEAGQGNFSWTIAWLALACAVALQVSVNLANDYFDYLAGVDGELRQGPARVDGKGGIALEQVKWARSEER